MDIYKMERLDPIDIGFLVGLLMITLILVFITTKMFMTRFKSSEANEWLLVIRGG